MDDIFEKLITDPCLGLLLIPELTEHQVGLISAIFEVRAVEIEGIDRLVVPCVYWECEEGKPAVVEQLEFKIEEIKENGL